MSDKKTGLEEGIELAVHIMLDQLREHSKESGIMENKDVRSLTDIAKTLNMINRATKEYPEDDANDIKNLSLEELEKRVKDLVSG